MTDTLAAGRAMAEVKTPQARRYMLQLCKHFEHKLAVTYDDTTGKIPFTIGDCNLTADGELLTLNVVAPDPADLGRLEDVVARHLVRFAFREELPIEWRTI